MTGQIMIGRAQVLNAVHGIHDRTGTWPTSQAVAEHLERPIGDIERLLADLKRRRMVRDRQRQGQRVWMPWEEA